MKKFGSACVLVSGGVDSAVLLGETIKRYQKVSPLFVRCGLAWEDAEIHWLKKFLRAIRLPGIQPLTTVSLPMKDLYGRHWSITRRKTPGYRSQDSAVYLPGRNIFLLSKAAVFSALHDISTIFIGTLSGNPFPDGTLDFFRSAEETFSKGLDRKISIRAPFRSFSKEQVARRGADLPLHLSFSCLNPRGMKHCGRCNKCAERDKILRLIHPTR